MLQTNDAYDDLFDYYGQIYNVDPALGKTVFHLESDGDPNTPNSPAGAIGGMQFMPATAAHYGINPKDMTQAIPAAMANLAEGLQASGGDPAGALAYYNDGPKSVGQPFNQLPAETQEYIQKAQSYYPQIRVAQYAANGPPPGTATDTPTQYASAGPDPDQAFQAKWGIGAGASPATAGLSNENQFLKKWGLGAAPTSTPAPASESAPSGTGGYIRNAAAGVLDAGANTLNFLANPSGTIGQIPATAAVFAHDALAPVFGYQRFPNDVRNALLGDTVPQPGTRLVQGVGGLIGTNPLNVTADTPGQYITRLAAEGAGTAAMGAPGSLMAPAAGAAAALGGQLAGKLVPAWAAPAASLAGGLAAGGTVARAMGRPNPLSPDVTETRGVSTGALEPGTLPAPGAAAPAQQTVIPAPEFIPPGANVPILDRIYAAIHKVDQTAAGRPTEIPPTTVLDPLTGTVTPIRQPPSAPAAGPATVPRNPLNEPSSMPLPAQEEPVAATENPLAPPTATPASGPRGRLTPVLTQSQADAEADRILRHFAGNGPTEVDTEPTPSGSQRTLSQAIIGGNAGISGLERGVREMPDQVQNFVAQEQRNTGLMNQAVGNVIGDPRATDVAEAELNKVTGPGKEAVFSPSNTTEADPSNAIAVIDRTLASEQGQRPGVVAPLNTIRQKLVDDEGNPQTDPRQLYGVDLAIRDMISPKAAGTANDGRQAAYELGQVQNALRPAIEEGAPGFLDWMANQRAQRSAITGQRYLQSQNITDRYGNVDFGKLDSTIKNAEKQQAQPGANPADNVTDEQLGQLKELRAEFQNRAQQSLGKAIGSPTVQKLGVAGAMNALGHPIVEGATGVGGYLTAHPLLAGAVMGAGYGFRKLNARGQAMVLDALRDKLLNPEKAQSAFPP